MNLALFAIGDATQLWQVALAAWIATTVLAAGCTLHSARPAPFRTSTVRQQG